MQKKEKDSMRYISTNGKTPGTTLAHAAEACVAPDGGLYIPERIPELPRAFFNNLGDMTMRDIAYVVCSSFMDGEFPAATVKEIVDSAFATEAPLAGVGFDTHVLELFHGPTLTFKDYGSRFFGALLSRVPAPGRRRVVLVSTVGNSGASTAYGFGGEKGVEVFVLYPTGVLGRMARRQFTAAAPNVHALEVMGTIDDCKALVAASVADEGLSELSLTCANSLNIARVLPQVVFAFHAYARMLGAGVRNAGRAVYSIPCGNLGNLVAALIARRMGLPMGAIVGVSNANDALRRNLAEAVGPDERPVATYAPSMDLLRPSGLPRLTALCGGADGVERQITVAAPVSDRDIAAAILRLRTDYGYTIDPHGAAAYVGAMRAKAPAGVPRVVFATAHPAKNLDIMTAITGAPVELPVQLTRFMSGGRHPLVMPATMAALRRALLANPRK